MHKFGKFACTMVSGVFIAMGVASGIMALTIIIAR